MPEAFRTSSTWSTCVSGRERSVQRVRMVEDGRLGARIVRRHPMRYTAGADASHDRPAHVRAASGLAWVGEHLAVIQDDASFIALVDPASGAAQAFPLPANPDGVRQFDDMRGNKAGKLDLEALATIPSETGVLLAAFGSGSLAPRETVVLIAFTSAAPQIVVYPASAFYSLLRQAADFAGSDMNVEGALQVGQTLTLFGRGNGAVKGQLRPVNASCAVQWQELMRHLEHPAAVAPPVPGSITQYELGELDGVVLGFTDVASGPGERMLFAAAAEISPDATRDGEVRGSAMGVAEPGAQEGRWARVRDESGRPFMGKIEGLTLDRHNPHRLFAVVDADDSTRPSDLLEVHLAGPWWSADAAP